MKVAPGIGTKASGICLPPAAAVGNSLRTSAHGSCAPSRCVYVMKQLSHQKMHFLLLCRCIIERQQRRFDAESCRLLCNFAEVVVREIEKDEAQV